jgi:cyanocobalamin reductase (cyanide-eliminating) / alkylcobalamin dealkylase
MLVGVHWREVSDGISSRLAACGLDLVAPFALGAQLALVVGNSRALWPPFKAWLADGDRSRSALPHPLEAYVEAVIATAVFHAPPCTVRFAHEGPRWPPIQRLAEQAGLAWLAPSNLAIHPVFGPWISLRALITVDVPGPTTPPAPAPACTACAHACAPAFDKARRTLDPADVSSSARSAWHAWLAVRDACPTGRAHRFQADHILYGYTKDHAALGNG